jgi:hypothetical protein
MPCTEQIQIADIIEDSAPSVAMSASVWMSTVEFADLAGLKERAARDALTNCFNNGTWRGVTLKVVQQAGCGGQGGKALQVLASSLPPNLRDVWHKRHPAALNPPSVAPITLPAPSSFDSRMEKEVLEWQWKLSVIAPALEFPKHSKGRGTVLADIAAKLHTQPDGKTTTYSVGTLREWLKKVEDGDAKTLARKRRKTGLRRVIITKKWDKAAQLQEPEKRRIAIEIENYSRDLWRNVTSGWKKIDLLTSSKLWELSRAAGWKEASREACKVGRHWVERYRAVGLVAIKEKDAKLFADEFTPRIIRNRDGYKPMDVVIGDVHPLDVVKMHDGREVHARLIAWLDLATYDIHVTVVLLPKGRGIRQEDIARSFVAMVNDWGLPRSLYLDNGSEYKWEEMMSGFRAITALVDSFHAFVNEDAADEIRRLVEANLSDKPLTRAKPYNAPAKQIESVFGILERGFFSMIPGWIGGDRMNKRTHKLGAQPRTFDGGDDEYHAAIDEVLSFYRNTPQNNGTSPNEKRAAFYAQGWQPYTAPREVFLFAFSEVINIKVRTNGIEKDGAWYYSDAIIPYIGQTIEMRFAKWDRSHLFLIDGNGRYIAIPKAQTYGQLDKAGAIEQGRRASVMNAHIRELKNGTQKLDLLEEVKRHNASLPPSPDLPKGIPITLGTESKALHKAIQDAPLAIVTPPLSGGTMRHPTTGQVLKIAALKPKDNTNASPAFDLIGAITAHHSTKERQQ